MTDITVPPFYLHSFVATRPDSADPVTEFANGEQIRLRWQSNGTLFTVYAANDSQPLYSGAEPTCLVAGRKTTTTFVLAAAVTGGPDSGTPNPAFETINLYEVLTVTIRNPDETPNSVTAGTLDVTGASQLRGDARLGNAAIGGTLGVGGAASLTGGATASGLTVSGAASLQGTTTLANATVDGALNVSGAAALAAATIGAITVTGSVTMMAPRAIPPGGYTASSDGILIGAVWWPDNTGQRCSAQVLGYAQGIGWVRATGGNTVIHQDAWSYTMWGVANTFSIPVQRGTYFQVAVQQVNDPQVDAPTAFWWVPFGRNATLTQVPAAEAAALGVPADEAQAPPAYAPSYDPGTAIAEVLDVVREVAGGELPPHLAEELTRALRSLALHQP